MPSSDEHHRRLIADADPHDKGSDSKAEPEIDDDEEYEEIEEEVEVEEEVEEEVEVEEDDEEIDEEDPSDSPVEEDGNDFSEDMESVGHEEQLRSLSSTPEKSIANIQPYGSPKFSGPGETRQNEEPCINIEDSKFPRIGKHQDASDDNGLQEFTADKNDSGMLPGKGTPKDHDDAHYDSKVHLCNSRIISSENTKPFSVSGKEVAASISIRDGSGEEDKAVLYSKDEIKEMSMQPREDTEQRTSRLAVRQIRPRNLSPGAESKDENKRPAVICDFFAKGWCIKGNSCRFLHIKDFANVTSRRPEGDVTAGNQKSELPADEEGFGDGTERLGLPGFPDAAVSLERIPSPEDGESQGLNQSGEKRKFLPLQREESSSGVSPDSRELPLRKDNSRSISPLKDGGRGSLSQNWWSEDYGNHASPIVKGSSPAQRRSLFLEQKSFSSSSDTWSDTYRSTRVPSSATNLEEVTGKRGPYILNDRHSSPMLSRFMSSSLSTSLQSTGMLPSQHSSAWTSSSSPFSSSFNIDPLGAQKPLDSDKEHHALRSSFSLRSSSSFSGSKSENFSLTDISGDPMLLGGHKTKFSSNDWEPSVPFRSSFLITPQITSSPGSQYDPIRDSIEQPSLGDGFPRFSFSSQGTSLLSAHQLVDDDPVLTGTLGTDYNSEKHSISGHQKFHDNVMDKNFYRKDLLTSEAETSGTAAAEQKNRNTFPIEEKLLSPAHVRDSMKANKTNIDHGLQNDRPRHRKEIKVDRGRANNEVDVDLKIDGEGQKEPKALKHFRAALVDFVKELVKPTWREGLLSKDGHKMIVKKAVDKVLGTLQHQQIPSTVESIKQYLSLSQPKIAKLVEGYIEKYGKS